MALAARIGPALVAAVLLFASSPAQAAPSKTELEARQEFAAGRYDKALDLFAKLYAETLHPTYLRNIGRCHQLMDEPEKAIGSFRDYLRKAKGVTPDERAEVEGYIKEMEELRKSRAAPPAGPAPEVKRLPEVKTLPEATPVSLAAAAPPPVESPAVYQRGWFWVVVGVVVLGGVAGGLAAAGVFSPAKDPACAGGYMCK